MEDSDGEVAPGGHHAWCLAGSQLGNVFREVGVCDVVQGCNLSVVADEWASWAAVACSAVRLVMALTVSAVLPVLWSVRRRLIWTA